MSDDKVKIIVEGKDEASPAFKSAGDSIGALGTVAIGVATGAFAILAGAIAGVAAIIKTTLPMAMDYETAVTDMKIASGGAGMSLEDLSDIALKVGMDMDLVGVDASGAAGAITNLFKAGLSVNEVFGDARGYLQGTAELGGALRASIDYAAASEYDLAGASEVAAIALNMFGGELETAEERAEFINFALDNTIRTADASVASVADIVAGWQGFGPMAVAAGMSIEEVNASLAIMTGRGFSGSEAGIMLKSMFKKVIDPTDDFTEACNELGLQLYDNEGRFVGMREYIRQAEEALTGVKEVTVEVGGRTKEQNELLEHAQDRYKTLTQRINDHNLGLNTMSDKALAKANEELAASARVIDELGSITGTTTTKTQKLTEEQQLQYAATLAGSYGIGAFTTFMAEGVEGYDEMIEATGVATGMQEQAAIKTETLAMKFEALEGVLETIGITVGMPVLEFLSGIVDKIAPALSVLDPFIEAWENVWTWLGNVFTLILDHGWSLRDLFTTTEGGRTIIENFFEALGMGEEQARPLGVAINNIVTAIFNFKDEVIKFITPIWEWITANVELKDVLIALGIMVLPTVIGALWGLASAILGVMLSAAPILLIFGALVLGVVLLREAWEQNWGGIRDKAQIVWDWLQENIPKAWQWIKDKVEEIGNKLRDWWAEHGDEIMTKAEEVWTWIKDTVEEIINTIYDIVVEISENLQDFWDEHGDEIMRIAGEAWTWIKDEVERLINLIKDIVEKVANAIKDFWDQHGEDIKEIVKNAYEWIKDKVQYFLDKIEDIFELFDLAQRGDWFEFGQKLRTLVDDIHADIKQIFQDMWDGLKTMYQEAVDKLMLIIAQFVLDIIAKFQDTDWNEVGGSIMEGIKQGIKDKIESVAKAVVAAAKAILEAGKGFIAGESPSRLFAEEIGKPIAEGIALGITEGIGDITRATELVLSGTILQTQATVLGGGLALGSATTNTSAVTNYNYTINAQYVSQDERDLIRDIRALQLLRG